MEKLDRNLVKITTFGVHTCRYNSLVSIPHMNKVIYTLGNKVILKCLDTFKELCCLQLMEDAIMVVR